MEERHRRLFDWIMAYVVMLTNNSLTPDRKILEFGRLKSLRLWGLVGLLLLSTPPISRGDSEIVVAIRYLQAKGTSHSHLYLYREDGKLLRQLTNDNSGQDSDPIFASDGETIVFTREVK